MDCTLPKGKTSDLSAIDRLAIAGGVEIFQCSHQRAAAALVKRPRSLVVRLGRGLDIDVPATFTADDLGDFVHDLSAQPPALDRLIHGNPIQVVAADGQGDGTIAGVAD